MDSSPEYAAILKHLASGWNTWNTRSVLSHVLLPQGYAVNLGFKEYSQGGYLKEALAGRRGHETVAPGLHEGTTKNDEARSLPYGLLPELVDVIEVQWAEHRRLAAEGTLCPFVFTRNGREIKTFNDAWRSACKKAGCPRMIPHDFRRTAVRNLVCAGVPEKTAMAITGHKTRSVFDRHNIVDERDKANALGMLSDSGARGKQGENAKSPRVAQIR